MPYGIVDYPIDYKEACFYAWWQAGRPIANVLRHLPVSPDGRKPTMETVRKWMRGGEGWENWHEHADRLDAELSIKLDKEAIEERARVLKQLAADGQRLKEKGMEYLNRDDPFADNPSAAVRAVVAGIEIQSKYSGMSDALAAIASMTPKQLEKEALRLLGKNENNDIIDLEEIQEEDNGDSNPEDD